MTTIALRTLVLAFVTSLAACVTPGPTSSTTEAGATNATTEVIAPNSNLLAQGIPPIPKQLAADVERYTDFRGHGIADWHPTKREMLVVYRKQGASTPQIFRLPSPMAEPQQLTDFTDPVTRATYEPRDGRYIVFQRSSGGNEAYQLYRMDLGDRRVVQLTDSNERHEFGGWLHRSSQMLFTSLPLDKTAQGGSRENIVQTLSLIDPSKPDETRQLAELPGGGWSVGAISWDDKLVALVRVLSANVSQIWLMRIADGQLTQFLPAPGGKPAAYDVRDFTRDNTALYVITDQFGEFNQLERYVVANRRITPLTRQISWDIEGVSQSADARLLALRANVDGRSELRLLDAARLRETPISGLPRGSVTQARFHQKLGDLAFAVNSSQSPNQIYTLDPRTGRVEQWTRGYAPAGVDTASFSEQQVVRWKSFDGLSISGLLNLPPARFTGKRPVIIAIHGGPESQATAGFISRFNYFVNELGIALIQPNVRGSSGYGKTFMTLDDARKREDSVKDIAALLDWIATQPQLDASRVIVTGGSYGGYVTLAVAANYPERIAGAVDVVGISNFVSFLQNTESYRRDLRRVEYGDERDAAMRDFLLSISPLTKASRITKPLFVVQGRNDPRVPYTEAEQIVAKARENNGTVWYLRAENEGHGFVRKENADFQFYATVQFLQQTILKP